MERYIRRQHNALISQLFSPVRERSSVIKIAFNRLVYKYYRTCMTSAILLYYKCAIISAVNEAEACGMCKSRISIYTHSLALSFILFEYLLKTPSCKILLKYA
jgi:hypothetical protein